MNIDHTNIVEMDSVTEELKTQFIHTIGNNTVNKVTISRFTIANGEVRSMDAIVSFLVPISYQYLSAFKIPRNWIFLALNTNQHMEEKRLQHRKRR